MESKNRKRYQKLIQEEQICSLAEVVIERSKVDIIKIK